MRSPTEKMFASPISDKAKHDSFISLANSTEHFPPESLLTRSNKIIIDRKKQVKEILDKTTVKDISYLFDSYSPRIGGNSPLLSLSGYPLPLEISELQLLLDSDDYSLESIFKRAKYSRPYGRNDAVNLASWLDEMHSRYLSKLDYIMKEGNLVDKELTEIVEAVYLIALKESIKQIAVNCTERASILFKIFEILKYAWKKTPDDYLRIVNYTNKKCEEEKKVLKLKFKKRYETLMKSFKDLEEKMQAVQKENDLLKNSESILSQKLKEAKENIEHVLLDKRPSLKKLKIFMNVEVQTDEVYKSFKSGEGFKSFKSDLRLSSSEDEEDNEKDIAVESPGIEMRDENLAHLKKHVESANCSNKLILEDLYKYIITNFNDFYAWVDGFKIAYELTNSNKAEEGADGEKSTSKTTEEKLQTSRISLKTFKRESTKTFELKSGVTISRYISENSPIQILLGSIEALDKKKINNISKMTLKKLVNTIQNFINIARIKNNEQTSDFPLFIYSLLFNKYAMQQHIVDKKFKEIIASCLKYSYDTKVKIFSKMIGIGNIGFANSTMPIKNKLVLKMLDFMYTDKTGIMPESSNVFEYSSFPLVRAFECAKQYIEPLYSKGDLDKYKKQLEDIAVPDSINMNKSGLIDVYEFILITLTSHDEYQRKVFQGVKSCIDVLSGFNYITWEEANVLIRTFNPKKMLSEADKALIPMTHANEIEIEEFSLFCISKGLLRNEDFSSFFSKRLPSVNEITEKIPEVREELEELLLKVQGKIATLSYEDWNGKLGDILLEIKTSKEDHALKLWMLFWNEYQVIKKN